MANMSEDFIWFDEFITEPIIEMLQEWPVGVRVERWQYNEIGERRFVNSKIYQLLNEPVSPESE